MNIEMAYIVTSEYLKSRTNRGYAYISMCEWDTKNEEIVPWYVPCEGEILSMEEEGELYGTISELLSRDKQPTHVCRYVWDATSTDECGCDHSVWEDTWRGEQPDMLCDTSEDCKRWCESIGFIVWGSGK